MDRAEAIDRLKAHEADLRAMGIDRLSLFGSTARGDQRVDSDVDLVGTFAREARVGLFRYAAIMDRLEQIIGRKVDFVTEPVTKARLRTNIERDRVHVF